MQLYQLLYSPYDYVEIQDNYENWTRLSQKRDNLKNDIN